MIGFAISTIETLKKGDQKVLSLAKENGSSAGTINVSQFRYIEKPSFTDYLRSGWFINMVAAIDFTASNGELSEPSSLHRQSPQPGFYNDYEKAILSVGTILEPYAYQSKFSVFGFGGVPRFAGQNSVSHCFNLNGTPDPTV